MTVSVVSGQLAEQLREIRERSGLGLAALAARTPYSKSSWERYLNGKKPVPRQAVEALCELTGTPPGRLLALWELADAEWSGRARPVPAPEEPDRSVPDRPAAPPRTGVRWWAVAGALAGVAAACLTAAAFLDGEPDGRSRAATEPLVRNPGCRAAGCEGRSPVAMGCGGAGMITTLATHTASGGRRLELRHAQLCHTVWVRTTGLLPGDRVELSLPTGHTQQVTAEGGRDAGQYLATPMAAGDSGAGTRICLEVPGSRPECFTG
ncbi:XRE family transcriptional regulator [Streptomyces sp. NBC_00893]|uniref:helix-turn-helix domain-containing protein n=1 Tax=Streptomyces sp. NBC_00893 TaxID=2975862 RepID=UPI00225BC014|nr:XRE family transcriptional regulator [Streptomyces sp. NBC_00893]MCX4847437.1 XRE family transcriptional regulator [Streptomyces sp. NBC_00893]